MRVNYTTANTNPSYYGVKSKLVKTKNVGIRICRNPKSLLKDSGNKGLPATMGLVGLILPIPFASIAGYALGVAIVKLKKHFNKNNKPS